MTSPREVKGVDMPTKTNYRIVAMIPTEVFIDVNDIEQANKTMEWLKQKHPSVSLSGNGEAEVKFLMMEETTNAK